MKDNYKFYILSHKEDLDGQFCPTLLKMAYERHNVRIDKALVDYSTLRDGLRYIIEHAKEYDAIFITDLCFYEDETKSLLMELFNISGPKYIVVGHHWDTVEFMKTINIPNVINVSRYANSKKRVSATKNLFNYLLKSNMLFDGYNVSTIDTIVNAISDWDTWEWKGKNELAKTLQVFYSSLPTDEALIRLQKLCLNPIMTQDALVQDLERFSGTGYQEYIKSLEEVVNHATVIPFKDSCVKVFIMPDSLTNAFMVVGIDELLDRTDEILPTAAIFVGDSIKFYTNRFDVTEVTSTLGVPENYSRKTYCALGLDNFIDILKDLDVKSSRTGSKESFIIDAMQELLAASSSPTAENNLQASTKEIITILKQLKYTIGTMESCTSGSLASSITNIEGASSVLKASHVTYSNVAKIKEGVPATTIEKYGVYSSETAIAMAKAVIEKGNNVGIGVTGTLGNYDPANSDSEIGKVYFAICINDPHSKKVSVFDKTMHVPVETITSRKAQKEYVCNDIIIALLDFLKAYSNLFSVNEF